MTKQKIERMQSDPGYKQELRELRDYAIRVNQLAFYLKLLGVDGLSVADMKGAIDAVSRSSGGSSGGVPAGAKDYRTEAERQYQDSLQAIARHASLRMERIFDPQLFAAGEAAARRLRPTK